MAKRPSPIWHIMDIDITDLYPLENYAVFDRIRPLVWSNAAIVNACHYMMTLYQKKTTYDEIIKEFLSKGTIESTIALLYGATKAANDRMDVFWFGRIYRSSNLDSYINAVIQGVASYLPEPEIKDSGNNLDESYPDTQAEVKKKKIRKGMTGDTGSGLQNQSSTSRRPNSQNRRSGRSMNNSNDTGVSTEST